MKYFKLYTKKVIVTLILGLIILSLILSSLYNYNRRYVEKYIAEVNGEKISLTTLKKMFFITLNKQKKHLNKKFFKLDGNRNFIKKTYHHILSQLIDNILLEQYCKKMNFQIETQHVKNIILNVSGFQENGQFSKQKYLNYLEFMHLTNHEYINLIKRKINTHHLMNTIINTDFILDNENENIIKLLSQKRIFKQSVLKIYPKIKKLSVSDLEARQYFNKNKKNFYIPEKLKISFITLKPHKKYVKYTKKEIYDWYKKNIKRYSTIEKRKYSVIQIKNKNKALSILSELKKSPKTFCNIAKQKSIDPISSKNGGDIGWFSVNNLPEIIKKSHLQNKNDLSQLVPFKDTFLIFQLNDILHKNTKKISIVYKDIIKEIKNKKSLIIYQRLKNNIIKSIKKYPNRFDLILKENNLIPNRTEWFDKNSIPKTLNKPILKKIIFHTKLLNRKNKLKAHSGLIAVNKHQCFLLSIENYQKKTTKSFQSVQKNIIEIIKHQKFIQENQKKAEQILMQLNTKDADIIKLYKLTFDKEETISRYDKNPIKKIVFELPQPQKDKKVYTIYRDKNDNFIVIQLNKIFYEKFSQKEHDIIKNYLAQNNKKVILENLITSLRKNANIKYENID